MMIELVIMLKGAVHVDFLWQFYNKVHTSVKKLAKNQSGCSWISLLVLEPTVPDALNPKNLPLLPVLFFEKMATIIRCMLITAN